MSPLDPEIPRTGEQIHIPGGSLQPVLVAFGITVTIVGVTTTIILVIVGAVLTLATVVAWIRDTRREIDELPLEHH